MKILILTILMVLHVTTTLSQDTPPLTTFPKFTKSKVETSPPLFPQKPTVEEVLRALQLSGGNAFEPIRIVHELATFGPAIIPIVQEILQPDTLWTVGQPTDSAGFVAQAPLENRVLLIYALDAMGGPEAYRTLQLYGATHREPEIRGASLNALSHSALHRAQRGEISPDKESLHQLVLNMDDPTIVPSLKLTVAQLAREGVRRWTDQDFGLPLDSVTTVAIGREKQIMTLSEYRQYWWSLTEPKLVWSTTEGKYAVTK
jgi:hypothetical protein